MSEHFIKNIEIKNFKCFEDFKAEGFGRVNLIGGKNNVGKTAFMEACFITTSLDVSDMYKKLLEINTHRNVINQLLDTNPRVHDLRELIITYKKLNIFSSYHEIDIKEELNGNISIEIIDNMIFGKDEDISSSLSTKYNLSDLINFLDVNILHTKVANSMNFISQNSNADYSLNMIIDDAKLMNKLDVLNKYLFEMFKIDSIDTIKYKPFVKIGDKYSELAHFGQGIKTFINIISSMLLLEDDFIFIDEVENGIHYSHLDRLWEIILTISRDQKVQVFATTHSKECIESYARVAKKLEDKDITFIDLGKNKKNEIKAIVMNSERFQREIEMRNEVRGW